MTLADRWTLLAVAGSGGMGTVWSARDERGGGQVAVKVLDGTGEGEVARFEREARVLASLEHPAIVRYLAHGVSAGRRFLVLEWLEGVTLGVWVRANRPSVAEAVALAARVAEGLAAAHAAGVVHRDLKPSNLFLVGGDPRFVKLLDFGVALPLDAEELTQTGARVGTPSYMAPEQIRADRDVDARADVWALGVVLYQCLTRRRPFWSADPTAQLAKILTYHPPVVSALVPGVPMEVDRAVERMMAKDRTTRPTDGAAVLALLRSLGAPGGATAPSPSVLGDDEQRLRSVVICEVGAPRIRRSGESVTEAVGHPSDTDHVARVARDLGAEIELSDGRRLVAVFGATGSATDLAASAARCALAIHAASPSATVSVSMASGSSGTSQASSPLASEGTRIRDPDEVPSVRLDAVTAGLLGPAWDVGRDAGGHVLRGASAWAPRTLLGRPTPCVAREAELAALHAAFEAAVDEPMARVVVVRAPPGAGKSRLRHEFLHRLAAAGEDVEVFLGRGDALSAGTPYGILASALRRALGLREGEGGADARTRLLARLRATRTPDAEGVAEWLSELLGAPSAEGPSEALRAARADPLLLTQRLQRAFLAWLGAELRLRPVVFVLEDLHWGDAPTIRLLDVALRELADRPWLLLALARPELDEVVRRPFADRDVQELRLGPLSRRAARALVREVLGDAVSDEVVDELVLRSGGHALTLEELVRARAEGDGAELPGTVLALLRARLEAVDPATRRVLRAASVFGRGFPVDGVVRLLGAAGPEELDEPLRLLEAREVVMPAGPGLWRFRHDLVQQAAVAMLTDADRALGHRLAAGWLEEVGQVDPAVLAEHHHRGGQPERAGHWAAQAARQALEANDLDAALRWAERALRYDARTGAHHALLAEILGWRGAFPEAARAAATALPLLPVGSPAWLSAQAERAGAAGVQGEVDTLVAVACELTEVPDDPARREPFALAAARAAEQLLLLGREPEASALLARLDGDELSDLPRALGRLHAARALHACFVGDVQGNLVHTDRAVAAFDRAGDLRQAATRRERAGYARLDLGDAEGAEQRLRAALTEAEGLGLVNVAATAAHNLGLALSRLGRHAEAVELELTAAARFRASGNRRMEGACFEYLAIAHLEAGALVEAERTAREAVRLATEPTVLPLNLAESRAILARILVRAGRAAEASTLARAAAASLEALGGIDDGEALIRLALVEALRATGEHDAARQILGEACRRLLRRADALDPAWRVVFLERVPENRATLALAASDAAPR